MIRASAATPGGLTWSSCCGGVVSAAEKEAPGFSRLEVVCLPYLLVGLEVLVDVRRVLALGPVVLAMLWLLRAFIAVGLVMSLASWRRRVLAGLNPSSLPTGWFNFVIVSFVIILVVC